MEGRDTPEQSSGEAKEDPVQFDPTRMVNIIRRKDMIKQLASRYHADCRAICQDLLELQRKWEEFQYVQKRVAEETRQPARPVKRAKKGFQS